jgi:hypothetical protein
MQDRTTSIGKSQCGGHISLLCWLYELTSHKSLCIGENPLSNSTPQSYERGVSEAEAVRAASEPAAGNDRIIVIFTSAHKRNSWEAI